MSGQTYLVFGISQCEEILQNLTSCKQSPWQPEIVCANLVDKNDTQLTNISILTNVFK